MARADGKVEIPFTRLGLLVMLIALGSLVVLAQSPAGVGAVVAADGSGQYRSVQEAINAAPQDTIFLDRGRQYFEDSLIAGHVDFIFGGATAWFERCRLHALGNGYLAAASTPQDAPYGFVFAHGSITGEPDVKVYLGRPWRAYARVSFLETDMSDAVRPEGWHNWDHPDREQTARYEEFGTTGSGARAARRVRWAHALSAADAAKITVESVLAGSDRWDPRRVPAHPSSVRALDAPIRPPASDLRPPI